ADQALVVGEDADDVGASADLFVEALERVGGAQLAPVRARERVEGQDVGLGVREHRWPKQSLRKCTVQRCQAQPRTLAIAAFRPPWASEIASWTPTRPRLTKRAQEGGPERLGLGL